MNAIDLNEGLSTAQVQLREEAQRFAAGALRPAALELDDLSPGEVISSGSRLWDVFREAYRAGYHLRSSMGTADTGVAAVPLELPRVSRGTPLNKLGQRSLNQGEVIFDGAIRPLSMGRIALLA